MKLFISISLMLLGIAQFNWAQKSIQPSNLNSMSNVFGISAEGGLTNAFTDYKTNKLNYNIKGALEYFLPSSGIGNFGLRFFGTTGFISGKDVPYPQLNSTNEFKTKIDLLGGEVLYILSIADVVYPWVGGGLSNMWFDPKDANGKQLLNNVAGIYSKSILAYNGDVGVRIMVSKNLSFNFNVGVVTGKSDYLDDIKESTHDDIFYTYNVGLSYYFGRDKDSDGDGVPDSRDMCPDTPLGVQVDANGCPLDADGDGVPDYLDNCPDTPQGVAVDSHGCPLDADGDGVPDYLDKCPNTPAGVKVDVSGCPLDSDSDGVPDYLDKCPNTPHDVKVDAHGCPLDSDGDGVPDYLDKCPNTPYGVKVDANGCPIMKEEYKHFTLSGDANFNSGKADLLPVAFPILDKLADAMKNNPNYKWIVEGYTDSRGKDAMNMKLSERRAQSVVNYLVSKGVDKSIFTVKAFGKANPVGNNKTAEGRAKNRRVEIKVIQ